MAAEKANGVEVDEKITCRTCKTIFKEWTAYHNHKMTSSDHISCDICSADFHTDEGLKRHRTLMHPKEQSLSCLGCGKQYIRLGSLISHVELNSCQAVNEARGTLAARKRQRHELHEKFKAGLKEIDENAGPRTGVSLLDSQDIPARVTNNNPPPPTFEGKTTTNFEFGGWETTILEEDTEPLKSLSDIVSNKPEPVIELEPEEDLICFGEVDKAMSKPWGVPSKKSTSKSIEEVHYEYPEDGFPIAIPPPMKESNFPALPSASNFKDIGMKAPNFMDAPLEEPKFTSIWDSNRIFANTRNDNPSAPTAATPATGVAARAGELQPLHERALIKPLPEKEYAPFDPSDPTFRAQRYWVPFTQKFKCPHRLCTKSCGSEVGFIQHLHSTHSGRRRLTCPSCYRNFGTYTALTQHCESQGVRCKIREAVNYGKIVSDITSSVADVEGRHEDDTVRYTVNKEGWGDLATRHLEAERKNAENKAKYWKKHDQEFEW